MLLSIRDVWVVAWVASGSTVPARLKLAMLKLARLK
jgi:hypothetical protein